MANDTSNRQTIAEIQFWSYAVVLVVILTFGIVGNLCNLVTLRSATLQAVSYRYLRALAVADLSCMLFLVPFAVQIQNRFKHSYSFAWYQAHLELPLINSFIASGIFVIVALTVDRYVSVVWPTHFRDWNTPKRANIAIFLAYLSSFIFYLPFCFKMHVTIKNKTGVIEYGQQDNEAIVNMTVYSIYLWLKEVLIRVLPIVLLAYLNIHIIVEFRRIRARRARMKGHSTRQTNPNQPQQKGSQNVRDDSRLMVLLAGIVVLFFVCNIPAAVNTAFIRDNHKKSVGYQLFRAVANVLEIANHAINFYIFCMCSTDYRNEFLKIFPCIRRLRQFQRVPASLHTRFSTKNVDKSHVDNGSPLVEVSLQNGPAGSSSSGHTKHSSDCTKVTTASSSTGPTISLRCNGESEYLLTEKDSTDQGFKEGAVPQLDCVQIHEEKTSDSSISFACLVNDKVSVHNNYKCSTVSNDVFL